MLGSVGHKVGKRTSISSFTEIVFKDTKSNDRPDGLIILKSGTKSWSALIEAKVGNNNLDLDQIERYRTLARENGIDCVITISNQFTSSPQIHPLTSELNNRLQIPVYHWSWMFILTHVDLLISNSDVADADQEYLLREFRRFMSHDSAGVKGFDRMPPEWSELNRLVSSGGKILVKSPEAITTVTAWHQETRDLSLILSRQTETHVTEKMGRRDANNQAERQKAALTVLSETKCLHSNLEIPDAAALLEITVDLPRRTVEVGMSIRAPEDRQSSKARINWLLRQIKSENLTDLFIRLSWPGRSEDTQFPYHKLIEDSSIVEENKPGMQVHSFFVYFSKNLGSKFTQQTNFISELEKVVPDFYREVGQNISSWRKSAPKIRSDKATAEDVSVQDISDDPEHDG